jgi:hypothetical protein
MVYFFSGVNSWVTFTLLNPAFGWFATRNLTGQVSLVGIDLFDLLFGMTTERSAEGQEECHADLLS